MRDPRLALLPMLALPLLLVGCGDGPTAAASLEPEVLNARGGPGPADASRQFIAHLSGDQEVPAVETRATGQATFRLSRDGTELSYRLIVANIEDVRMAHIHLGPVDDTGPVVVWLYPEGGPPPVLIPGRSDGVLATGVVTEADVIGPLGPEAEPFEALVEAMRAGNTYVNVHTTANPPGEIRGQIR